MAPQTSEPIALSTRISHEEVPVVGQQPPPQGGYSTELFQSYLDEMQVRAEEMSAAGDYRAVFEITYLIFSREVLQALKDRRFEDMVWAVDIACRFIEVYREQLGLWESRHPALCRAWRAAFESMEEARVNVLQSMMLGINAHINYDLAFVTLGSSRHSGDLEEGDPVERALSGSLAGIPSVRYRDFLVINQLEWEAIQTIQDAVLGRYNRFLYWGNVLTLRSTRFMGQRFLMEARDTAWYRTTLLVHARTDQERSLVGRLIDARAASLADLASALTWRPDEAIENAVAWVRRGERIDPELQVGLLAFACRNPVISEILLRELASAGADPVLVISTLLRRGEARLAGLFANLALADAPIRRRQRFVRFVRRGTDEGLQMLDALLASGTPLRKLPRRFPVQGVRDRVRSEIARDRAILDLPEVSEDPTLVAAIRWHLARTERRLREELEDSMAVSPAAGPSLTKADAIRLLSSHPDPWVRTCSAAVPHLCPPESLPEREAMVSTIEKVLFLKETAVFLEVDMPVLVNVAEHLESRSFSSGEPLVRQGEPTGGLYLISEGTVEVSIRHGSGTVPVAQLGPRESVGELSALNGTPASADCTATGPVHCWHLQQSVLSRLLHQHPRLGIGLIRMLSQRLVETTAQLRGAEGS